MFASEACLELISVEHVARSVDVIRTDMFDQTAGGKTLWELTGVEGKDTSRDATETVDGAGRSDAWLQRIRNCRSRPLGYCWQTYGR